MTNHSFHLCGGFGLETAQELGFARLELLNKARQGAEGKECGEGAGPNVDAG